MAASRYIGTITRLQVQSASLMEERPDGRWFNPEPLRACDWLELTADGATGPDPAGKRLNDIHNRSHPQTRYRDGNALSVGFTSHHTRIETHFGRELPPTAAGENIIVECDEAIEPQLVAGGLCIESAQGWVTLDHVVPAPPCLPFVRYLIGRPDLPALEASAALQFLDQGMRGFYAALQLATREVIKVGDQVWTLATAP